MPPINSTLSSARYFFKRVRDFGELLGHQLISAGVQFQAGLDVRRAVRHSHRVNRREHAGFNSQLPANARVAPMIAQGDADAFFARGSLRQYASRRIQKCRGDSTDHAELHKIPARNFLLLHFGPPIIYRPCSSRESWRSLCFPHYGIWQAWRLVSAKVVSTRVESCQEIKCSAL